MGVNVVAVPLDAASDLVERLGRHCRLLRSHIAMLRAGYPHFYACMMPMVDTHGNTSTFVLGPSPGEEAAASVYVVAMTLWSLLRAVKRESDPAGLSYELRVAEANGFTILHLTDHIVIYNLSGAAYEVLAYPLMHVVRKRVETLEPKAKQIIERVVQRLRGFLGPLST